METIALETLGAGGVITAVVVGLILWKVLKLAFKVALFLVVAAVLAAGVAMFLDGRPPALPVEAPAR